MIPTVRGDLFATDEFPRWHFSSGQSLNSARKKMVKSSKNGAPGFCDTKIYIVLLSSDDAPLRGIDISFSIILLSTSRSLRKFFTSSIRSGLYERLRNRLDVDDAGFREANENKRRWKKFARSGVAAPTSSNRTPSFFPGL